jgi:hypothetical protein
MAGTPEGLAPDRPAITVLPASVRVMPALVRVFPAAVKLIPAYVTIYPAIDKTTAASLKDVPAGLFGSATGRGSHVQACRPAIFGCGHPVYGRRKDVQACPGRIFTFRSPF